MKIDFSTWRTFLFTDVFIIKKGFYNKKPEESGNGTIPFLGATDKNNGVTAYYTLDEINSSSKTGSLPNDTIDKKIFPGKSICVTNNGSVGYAYYQETEFTCSHDVNPLYRKDGEFNYFTGLFVASIIMKDRYRWGYGRKWRPERMVKSKINLPATNEGKPDWDWMERFMRSLKSMPIKTDNRESLTNLNVTTWKDFLLGKLFENIYKSYAYIKSDLTFFSEYYQGRIPFISRTDINNGCDGYVPISEIDRIEKGNAIIIGDTTSTIYYQKENFVTGDHIVICRANWINQYTALFIKTLIERERYKYNYGRAFKMDLIKNTKIKLPILTDGNDYVFDKNKKYSDKGYVPDWKFMENYIKSLPYGDRIND